MTGQPVPLSPPDVGAADEGFAVVVRLRDADEEREGVGADVTGALDDLTHQIDRTPEGPSAGERTSMDG
jgi:hypothetical protein